MPAPKPTPTIAILLPVDSPLRRHMLVGIGRYAHTYGPWRFHSNLIQSTSGYRLPHGWQGQGVIAWVGTPEIYANLRHVQAPIVNVANRVTFQPKLPRIVGNQEERGRLAARHLIECGLKHFAYGISKLSTPMYRGFHRTLDEAGMADRIDHFPAPDLWPRKARLWRDHARRLLEWIQTLPTPVGVLTPHCLIGQALIQTCMAHGIRVPDDVAVLNIEDDAVVCEMCHPSLSAIDYGSDRLGYEAAALLDRLMHGEPPPSEPILIPPAGVVRRQSTDPLAFEDVEVAQAVRFIREHIREPITVADILRAVPVARRSLERRFNQLVGHSPAEEIRRLRLRRAQDLLTSTAMPMPAVAAAAGFASAEYMARVFRQRLGVSPYAYRTRTRQPGQIVAGRSPASGP